MPAAFCSHRDWHCLSNCHWPCNAYSRRLKLYLSHSSCLPLLHPQAARSPESATELGSPAASGSEGLNLGTAGPELGPQVVAAAFCSHIIFAMVSVQPQPAMLTLAAAGSGCIQLMFAGLRSCQCLLYDHSCQCVCVFGGSEPLAGRLQSAAASGC